MGWTEAVDIYCERTSAAFWAEPVNAVTNLSFVLAALIAARTARRLGIRAPIAWVLIVLAGLIGIGSFLFHTFANQWSALADVLPIWTFVALFVLTAMHQIGGMPVRRVLTWAGAVAILAVGAIVFAMGEGGGEAAAVPTSPDPLNGSGQYAPALLALVVFSVVSWRRRHPGAPWIIAATGVFLLSLTFRTLDRDICAVLPLGTHWGWHLLNGLLIGLLLQMLLRTGRFAR